MLSFHLLSVKDNGVGFDWQNYGLGTADKFAESGRGLSIVSQLVDDLSFNEIGNKVTAAFEQGRTILSLNPYIWLNLQLGYPPCFV